MLKSKGVNNASLKRLHAISWVFWSPWPSIIWAQRYRSNEIIVQQGELLSPNASRDTETPINTNTYTVLLYRNQLHTDLLPFKQLLIHYRWWMTTNSSSYPQFEALKRFQDVSHWRYQCRHVLCLGNLLSIQK